jgi:hypothetical protein
VRSRVGIPGYLLKELSPESADLPPLDVPIDATKWHQPKNQGRPRNQSVEGQQEIKRHLEKLLECGAISPVLHASAYSQVLLVSKPDTKEKRLVLDYRALNECVGHMNWPLPNISHMIERIGALKPKKFARFDMIKGYWQLDLAPAVRQATVFITWMGIFVWNRIPKGLQPAASYFQYLHANDSFGRARLLSYAKVILTISLLMDKMIPICW